MKSIRGQIIKKLLQNRHLFSGKIKKEVLDWNDIENIIKFREEVEAGAEKFGKISDEIDITPLKIDSLYAEWLTPKKEIKSNAVILYFHGGGYVSGTCKSHRTITSKFVIETGMKTLLFEYRLAPENPYPAALEDSIKAYEWLLSQNIKSQNIVFIGDSAGGGLCLATLLALKDRKIPLPTAAVAYSPITDFTCSSDTHRTNIDKCLSPKGMTQALAKHYSGEVSPENPYISPLFGNLEELPSLLIYAGEDEILCDDAVRFYEKAKKSRVDVSLEIGKGLFHCYPAMAPLFPEATKALNDIAIFVKNHIDQT